MRHYTIDEILSVMDKFKFNVFNGYSRAGFYQDYDLNLVGIRSINTKSDSFDDLYVIFYKLNKEWQIHYLPCTTDPGRDELVNPSFAEAKKDGTLILKHDEQYRRSWTLGYHGRGNWRHVALIQTAPVLGYRDNNRNDVLDMIPKTITSGLYGANHHAASLSSVTPRVANWSAGCQVIHNPSDYLIAKDLWQKAAKLWGTTFSYTILHESNFIL